MRLSPDDVAVLSENIDQRTGQSATVLLSRGKRVSGYNMEDVADAAKAAIGQIGLPAGYDTVFGCDVQNLEETNGYVLEALFLAVVFIYDSRVALRELLAAAGDHTVAAAVVPC